ncbi:MAG: HAD family phosphatase [Planctomycetaceae bacterium]|nr:HAD family phosphatase [Planctomycetaceae bacterium]
MNASDSTYTHHKRPTPTTVVFDLDGLIFNTEDIFLEATNQLLAPLGKKQTPEIVGQIMGQPSDVSTQILKDYHSLTDSVTQIRMDLDRHFDLVLDSILAFMPGFEGLLQRLIEAEIPRAICTSSSANYAADLIGRFGYLEQFEVIVGGDQIVNGKPAPDAYLKVAELLKIDPTTMLVLEDSENGCRAAIAAGAFTVAVPASHNLGQSYDDVDLIADKLSDPRILSALGI